MTHGFSCHRTASNAYWMIRTLFIEVTLVFGGIRTCLGISTDLMFLCVYSNSCPLNLLLVRSHHATIIIIKRLIQGCNNVTTALIEPRSCDQLVVTKTPLPVTLLYMFKSLLVSAKTSSKLNFKTCNLFSLQIPRLHANNCIEIVMGSFQKFLNSCTFK